MTENLERMIKMGTAAIDALAYDQLPENMIHSEIAKAVILAITPAPAVNLGMVKPLKWSGHLGRPSLYDEWCAYTMIGRYIINDMGKCFSWLLQGDNGLGWVKAKSLDEAKAAAQADYERRILSALTQTSPHAAGETSGYEVIGTTHDGVKVLAPAVASKNFTREEVQHAVAQAAGETGTPSPQADMVAKCLHCDGTGDVSEKGRIEHCLACDGTGTQTEKPFAWLVKIFTDSGMLLDTRLEFVKPVFGDDRKAEFIPLYPSPQADVRSFQDRVADAHHALFHDDPTDVAERVARFFEEAAETCQALGMTHYDADKLLNYTFDRPVGDPAKEIGSAMLTLASLCVVAGYDMAACGEADLEKLQRPETIARIRAKRATRHGRGPLPGFSPAAHAKEGE